MTRAEFTENLRVAMDTLRQHKVRSGLTVLGIVIGVTSVISVAAIIEGLNGYISQRVEKMGSRTYFISRFSFAAGFGRVPEKIRRRKFIQMSEAAYLEEVCGSLRAVAPFSGRPISPADPGAQQPNVMQYGSERVERIVLRGGGPAFGTAFPIFSVAYGRFITRYDEDHSRDVVVVGDAIATALFPSLDPLGKTVRLNGRLMEVIGVLEKDPGLFGGPGLDQVAVIPLSTFHKHYPEVRELLIAFLVDERAELGPAVNEVVEAMRRIRRVPHNEENDFELVSPDFLTNLWKQLTGALVVLTGVVSSVGLLIGGVGVMNIMLISVTERTSEIGVRKAIGARRSDIRAQFLMEAMTLSGLGGVLGIAFGGIIAFLVRNLISYVPATVSYLWVALGVMISVGIGLFFGYYPASRAARLDPVVCLRHE
jgi:putative ABC transport system permease protein